MTMPSLVTAMMWQRFVNEETRRTTTTEATPHAYNRVSTHNRAIRLHTYHH